MGEAKGGKGGREGQLEFKFTLSAGKWDVITTTTAAE